MNGKCLQRSALVFLAATLAPAAAPATDRPVPLKALELRDASDPLGPKLVYKATLTPGPAADPRVSGATIEVVGNGAGEGSTGVVALHASRWRGLGLPPGSAGFAYTDVEAREGIESAVLRPDGTRSMRLRIAGGGPRLAFRIAAPHGPVDARFALGGDSWCARATSFTENTTGHLAARNHPAPESCPARVQRCGNGLVEGAEACDDGNAASGDGCTAGCVVEGAAGVCSGIPRAPNDRARLTPIAEGIPSITHLTAPRLDPSRLFVVRQTGEVHILENGTLLPDPFLRLVANEDISVGGERGLLSLAFHPDYATNGRFFVFYTDPDGRLVIARYERGADPNRADESSRRIVLRQLHPRGNHNGGQLAFGPDGYLYAAFGDGGGAGDPDEAGQDLSTLLGKILRLDVDVDERPWRRVPAGNPFPGLGPRLGLIWGLGLRNPWRFSFDRLTGDLYIGDVGQNWVEEVDFEPAGSPGGSNFGWDIFEGSLCHEPGPLFPSCPSTQGYVFPVFEYAQDGEPPEPNGCAVVGGFVYRGCRLEGLQGEYFFSDLCSRFLRTIRVEGGALVAADNRTAELAPQGVRLGSITTFGEDARGELHIAEQSGRILVLAPDGS